MKRKVLFIVFLIFAIIAKGVVHSGPTIVSSALFLEGTAYVLGQPENEDGRFGGGGIMNHSFSSVDCSGLVSYAAGLRRHYSVQYGGLARFLNSVSWDNLQAGDVLMKSDHIVIFNHFDETYPNLIHYVSSTVSNGVKPGRQWESWFQGEGYLPYRFNTEAVAPEITITGVVDGMTYTDPVTLKFTATDNLETPSTYAYGQWKGPRFPQG
ncbi:MAG TPA: peptidoglycan endopeptidase, partial [candidate division WOR-3 bacterium]|nr:peptidoglycan endopeptidase [candidate division WOR-3 bacterium]